MMAAVIHVVSRTDTFERAARAPKQMLVEIKGGRRFCSTSCCAQRHPWASSNQKLDRFPASRTKSETFLGLEITLLEQIGWSPV
jgi:hypothetical protein